MKVRKIQKDPPVVHGELAADDVVRAFRQDFREIGGEAVPRYETCRERIVAAVVTLHRVAPHGLERDVNSSVSPYSSLLKFCQIASFPAREIQHAIFLADVAVDHHALHLHGGSEQRGEGGRGSFREPACDDDEMARAGKGKGAFV